MKIPKYQKVRDQILSDIHQGVFKAGECLPIREKLLKQFKVTRTTLDKALIELIRSGILQTSKRGGTRVATYPIRKKVAFMSPYSNLSDLERVDYSSFQVILEFNKRAMVSNQLEIFHIDFGLINSSPEHLMQFDVIIAFMPKDEIILHLKSLKHKTILVNRYVEGFRYISTHHANAMKEITNNLIQKYNKNSQVIYLDRDIENFITIERRKGFLTACEENEKFYQILKLEDVQTFKKSLSEDKFKIIITPITINNIFNDLLKDKRFIWGETFICADFDNYEAKHLFGHSIPTILQSFNLMGEELYHSVVNFDSINTQKFIAHECITD